jgi:hypothetical protein
VLAEAGVQHVIMNFAETNETDLIELLGSRVLPQFRDIEAADPRTLAANVPEAVTAIGGPTGQAVASWGAFPCWRIRMALPNGSRMPMSVP